MNTKERAIEIYAQHLALASTDPRVFRKTVREQLMSETGCTSAAASTHYNNCKKAGPVIEGLGRVPVAKGVRKMAGKTGKQADVVIQDDNECFTVIELVKTESNFTVGRCQSFLMQGDASECFDSKTEAWPSMDWIMIQGLGPNHGDNFRIGEGEQEIKRYTPITGEDLISMGEKVDTKSEETV